MNIISREKGENRVRGDDRSEANFCFPMVLMTDLQPDGDELKLVRVASKKEKAALIQ